MRKKKKVKQEYMTTQEAAIRLGVTVQTIRNWVKRGVLEGIKIGGRYFIRVESLEGNSRK